MRTKLKDVVSGYVLERRFNIGEKLKMCVWNTVLISSCTKRAMIIFS